MLRLLTGLMQGLPSFSFPEPFNCIFSQTSPILKSEMCESQFFLPQSIDLSSCLAIQLTANIEACLIYVFGQNLKPSTKEVQMNKLI